MARLKLMLWNVEWMNDLFTAGTGPAAFRPDSEKPLHNKDTTGKVRRDHLSGVLKEIGPDIVVVAEGPSRREELVLFFEKDVPGSWKVDLQPTAGQSQNIRIAVRTDTGKFLPPTLTRQDTNADKDVTT